MKDFKLPEGHTIQVFESVDALMEGAAREIVSRLSLGRAVARLVLPGGRTPRPLFDILAKSVKLDWNRVWLTFSDERAVPPGRPDSNYRSALQVLLEPLGIPVNSVIRLRGEDLPEVAAQKAHRELQVWAQRQPLFDLVILGLGADAHVASLFPADNWPDYGMSYAAATHHPSGQDRITLTPLALRSTAFTLFLVSGGSKAEAVRATLTASEASPQHPARMVVPPGGQALWLLDTDAASALPEAWRT